MGIFYRLSQQEQQQVLACQLSENISHFEKDKRTKLREMNGDSQAAFLFLTPSFTHMLMCVPTPLRLSCRFMMQQPHKKRKVGGCTTRESVELAIKVRRMDQTTAVEFEAQQRKIEVKRAGGDFGSKASI